MALAGDQLGDEFRILEVLSGGMGEVFICVFLDKDKDGTGGASAGSHALALKTFQKRFFFEHAVRVAFEREVNTWLRLTGLPHIMPTFGVRHIEDRPFLVMPAVQPGPQGERSVADLLRRGALESEEAFKFAFQLALAMRLATDRIEGLVHGDLKPANLLLMGGDAYLSDFGIANAADLGLPDKRLEGTWAYQAPELLADEPRAPSIASDVYAFGVLLFEMLTARNPYGPERRDRNSWSTAHRELSPVLPHESPAGELGVALMEFALECLAKDPVTRPRDFASVLESLDAIGSEFDPVLQLMVMTNASHMKYAMTEMAPHLAAERIRGLISLGQHAAALDELEALEPENYDASLWTLRGTTLSLLNRDEEALPCFEEALKGEMNPEQIVDGKSEYALTLKRLGRFDEAREIYNDLLPVVSDEQLPSVVVNLATVHLQVQDGDAAVRLLEPFVKKNPDVAPAWSNLGQAYIFTGRHEDAERALGAALRLAPNEGRVRVRLAGLYMDHFGRLEEAWAALDAAFDSGFESREWFVRFLTCSILLEKKEVAASALGGLRANAGEDLANELLEESLEMVRQLAKRFSESEAEEGAEPTPLDEAQLESSNSPDLGTESMGPESRSEEVPEQTPDAADEPASPGVPFLNIRFYDFHDFTLDFYQSPKVPDYVDSFLLEWRRAQRDPRISMSGTELRGTPFFITKCPECGVHVLTNREIRKRIRCRMCECEWRSEPLRNDKLDDFVAELSEAMNIQQPSGERIVHVLLTQFTSESHIESIREICEKFGFDELPQDSVLAQYIFREFLKRGAEFNKSWLAWTLKEVHQETWAKDATPRKVSAVVQALRDRVPDLRSMSSTVPAEEAAELEKGMLEMVEEVEKDLRRVLLEGRANANDICQLAGVLVTRGELEEAEKMARAAIALDGESPKAWEILGQALSKRGDFGGALEALEKAVVLNPNDSLVLYFLAACHEKLGNPDRANELRSRAVALSGGAPPI